MALSSTSHLRRIVLKPYVNAFVWLNETQNKAKMID